MFELGADPEQLRALATSMRAESRRISEATKRVTATVRASTWRGRDAHRFATTWAHHARMIDSVGGQLEDAAVELDRNVSEQLAASDSGPSSVAAGASNGVISVNRTGPDGRFLITNGHATYVPSRKPDQLDHRVDPGRPPIGEPLPLRTEVWEIGGGVAAGIGLKGTARLTVSELPGGRSVVSINDIDGVTAETGMSAEMGIENGPEVSLGVSTEGELTKQTNQSWIVDSDQIPDLLWRLGLRELIGGGILSPGIPFSTGGLGDLVLGPALDLLGKSAPEPDMVDLVVGLSASASATAALGVPILGVSGTAPSAVGLRQRGDATSLLVSGAGSYSTTVPGGGTSDGRTIDIEIPLEGEGGRQMIMTTTDIEGDSELVQRSVYSLGPLAGDALGKARGAVESGDPISAARAVHELWDGIEPEPIWADSVIGEVNDDIHSGDLGAAFGPEVSASLTGGRRVVEYRG